VRELIVPTECAEVEVTLRHSGKLPAKTMGHDWVLAKDSDMSGALQPGTRYAFFCTSPGHSTIMRGTFKFGDNSRLVRASEKTG
ncbi:MAG TPA: hypothetical protein VNH41_01130, partial [Steroidobacteraceae bacterium]|nr:hypothetical protein [Steroidobacteraceae bacterium]